MIISDVRWASEDRTSVTAIINEQHMAIPKVAENGEWQAIQRWQDEGNVIADPPPLIAAVPEQISDVQFFQQLAIQGDITQDEAEAAVSTGAIPSRILNAISQLPADQQFGARMKLKGSVIFNRHSPVTELLAHLLGKSDADTDAIWEAASKL